MKEWFSKEAVPKPTYPSVKWANLSEMPIPCYASYKYDGETTYVVKDAVQCYTVNRWGRVRTEYPITDAVQSLLERGRGVFIGELYVKDGNLYDFLRSRKDFERLRLAIFDVQVDKPYYLRYEVISDFFPKEGAVHLAEGKLITTRLELESFFSEAVRRGFEGIVCRPPNSRYEDSPYKLKKVRSADVVVLGISKDSERFKTGGGMIGSLLCGCIHQGRFVSVGRVGSGFSGEERKALYEALMDFKLREDNRYIYVKPALVVEVIYQELIQTKDFDAGITWRHPTFKRLRLDKQATEEDTSLEQQFPNS